MLTVVPLRVVAVVDAPLAAVERAVTAAVTEANGSAANGSAANGSAANGSAANGSAAVRVRPVETPGGVLVTVEQRAASWRRAATVRRLNRVLARIVALAGAEAPGG